MGSGLSRLYSGTMGSSEPQNGINYNTAGSSSVQNVQSVNDVGEAHSMPTKSEPNSVSQKYRNGKIYQERYFDENGEPATSGSYKDPRDGYSYEWIRIGSQLWTAENMNYATASGSLCAQCNHWGRLYNFENAKKACLEGFHMPTKAEWNELLAFAGKEKQVGTVLKAGYGWDPIKGTNNYGNGKDELGFGAKAGGAHFAKSDVPLKERKFEAAGQKAFFWTAEGEVLVFFYDKDIAKFEKFNPEYGASLRCIKD